MFMKQLLQSQNKQCDLVFASCWNEVAFTIAYAVNDIAPKAKGKYLTLFTDNSFLISLLPEPRYSEEFAYSEQCYNKHIPLGQFLENPVVP